MDMEQNQTNTPNKSGKLVHIPVLHEIEKTFVEFNETVPKLPANVLDIIVKVVPYLALIGGILGLWATVSALGMFGAVSMIVPINVTTPALFYIGLLFGVAASILDLVAFPKLQTNSKIGWDYLYYGAVLSFVQSVLSLNFIGAILGSLISMYLLFQIRHYYK